MGVQFMTEAERSPKVNEYERFASLAIADVYAELANANNDIVNDPRVDQNDVRSAAYLGVASAAATYDPTKGKFAAHCINGARYYITKHLHAEARALQIATCGLADDVVDIIDDGMEEPVNLAITAETACMVRSAVSDLAGDTRTVAQGVLDGASLASIADDMGITRQQARTLWATARQQLHRELAPYSNV